MLRSTLVAAALAAGLARSAAAQSAGDQTAFVTVLGRDTVALERYTRTSDRIEGDLVTRVPRVRLVHYVAVLGPDGMVKKFDVSIRPAGQAAPAAGARPMTGTVEFGSDTAHVTVVIGDSTRTLEVPARAGAVPLMGFSYAFYEQATMQLARSGRDSVAVDLVAVASPEPFTTGVARKGNGRVTIGFFGDPAAARVDRDGRLLSFDGTATTQKVMVTRVREVDLSRAAEEWSARESQGRGLGQLSPRDTARAAVGGATLLVDYGRPAKRGRTVYGGVVQWSKVWRTGANAATQLTTDRELELGGRTLPAGTYTLWTVPTPTGVTLIVNRQAGQWGTEHDPSQDLVRIKLATSRLADPVERFTIGIVPKGAGGVLRFDWDTSRWSVPFTVKAP